MGSTLIFIAFVSALVSSVAYFSVHYGKAKNISIARLFFHISAIAAISSAAFLLYLIITHQFQYTYVWNYSSRDLPLNLLISTFYAGQEGSFHLWSFLMAVLGIFLLSYTSQKDEDNKDRYEAQVMGVYTLLQTFLLFILVIKSPYLYVWESFPGEVQAGFIPLDGRGLNPLLQNFWMTIHPPILFIGFSALSIPFCFAVAALIKNEYNRWLRLALPWTLFGAMVLGTGIMLGGYWAYGVLGWGGYWGWDPVENSSLVPWIIIVAAIHTMLIEQKTGKFRKTSLLLCILAFVLVLYSTFLTRSGILGDASVHSFVDPGYEVYLFLVIFLSLFGAGGIGLIFLRLKSLRTDKSETSLLSRESALFIGAISLCAAALVIAVGTSWPIFAKGTVDPAFYNKMNLPLAILIGAINGFSILLKWRHSEEKEFLKSLYIPFGLTFVVTLFLIIVGMRDILIGVFTASSLFAFFINAEMAYRVFVRNRVKVGSYVAHVGVMVLFLGVIGSSRYSEEVNVSLPLNETKEALGYSLTYKGATPIPGDENKFHFNVVVEKDGKAFLLQPVMFYSEYNDGVMKNPDYATLPTKDVYLSPMALEVPEKFSNEDIVKLKKGEQKEFKGITIKFVDFDRSKFNREEMQEGKQNIIGAELEVISEGKTEKLFAEQILTGESKDYVPVQLENTDRYTFYLENISVAGESSIELAVTDNTVHQHVDSPETFVLTASIKPFINFVWIGTGVMVLGFFFSIINRYRRVKSNGGQVEQPSGKGSHKQVSANSSTNGLPGKSSQLRSQKKHRA